jgi:plasmid stability protein
MTNVTLSVDDQVLRRARIRALQQGTSVNALIRDYLERIAGESPAAAGIAEFLDIAAQARAASGGRSWTRDELYDI